MPSQKSPVLRGLGAPPLWEGPPRCSKDGNHGRPTPRRAGISGREDLVFSPRGVSKGSEESGNLAPEA